MASLLLLLTLSLGSCIPVSDASSPAIDYDYSCDVPLSGWRSQDTLFYPISVLTAPERRHPLRLGTDYDVWCSVRMTSSYPYGDVPMTLVVQQMEEVTHPVDSLTTRTTIEVLRNILRHDLTAQVRLDTGEPLGGSWGSLITYDAPVHDHLSLRFDTTGTYRLLIIPKVPSGVSLTGLSAIGLTLRRH